MGAVIIAGLTGDIGHGKTTFADFLAAQSKRACHIETWEVVAEVAEALKEVSSAHPKRDDIDGINQWLEVLPNLALLRVHADIQYESIKLTPQRLQDHPAHYVKLLEYLEEAATNPRLTTEPITNDNKEQFRPLLQWVGGFLAIRVDGIWYSEIMRRIRHLATQGVDLVTVGGVRFPRDAEILRNGGGTILEVVRPGYDTRDGSDLTERERKLIQPDSVILNNGSLAELQTCAATVWHDLVLRDLQANYSAHTGAPELSKSI